MDGSVENAIRDETERPFDLADGPPLRVRVHRLGSEDHVVQWTIHHLATDAWSLGVQLRELGTAYHAFAEGTEPDLPPLAGDYGEFVAWHRDYVAGPEYREDLDWWRGYLAGAPPTTGLEPRPPFAHAWRNVRVEPGTASAMSRLARSVDATPYMVVLAAFALVLAADTGRDDLLIVTPNALRTQSRWEGLVGWFVNRVVVRIRVDRAGTFADLVAHARGSALAAFAHPRVPFELLRTELGLADGALAVQVSVQNAPVTATGFRGFDIAVVGDGSGRGFAPILDVYSPVGARYRSSVVLRERPDGSVAGGLEFDASVVDPARAARWHDDFLAVLAAGTAAPDTPLTKLIPEQRSSGD